MKLLQPFILFSLFALSAMTTSAQLTGLPMGKIDRTFGDNGSRISKVGFGIYFGGLLILLPDGKTVWANTYRTPAGNEPDQAQITKLLADGSPDTSFGTNGNVKLAFDPSIFIAAPVALPNSKILVVGSTGRFFNSDSDALVFQLTASGTLDPSFADSGVLRRSFGDPASGSFSSDLASAALVYPDGKILVGIISNTGTQSTESTTISTTIRLLKINSDGSTDSSFGKNGIVERILYPTAGLFYSSRPITLAADGDDKFLVTFDKVTVKEGEGTEEHGYISRYFNDGTLDTSFADKGTYTCTPGYPFFLTTCRDLTVLPDRKILGLMEANAIFRLKTDGTPDSGFGTGGIWSFSLATSRIGFYSVTPDQKILVSSNVREGTPSGYRYVGSVTRLYPDGKTDLHFGRMGSTIVDYSPPFGGFYPSGGRIGSGIPFQIDDRNILATSVYEYDPGYASPMVTRIISSK